MSEIMPKQCPMCGNPDCNGLLCTITRTPIESSRNEVEEAKYARAWLLSGGGGFEDGEDGLRAVMVSGEGLIDFLADYAAHLRTQERERSDAQSDRQWIAGAQFGWNCGTHKELNDAIDARRKELIAAAIREGE